MWHCPPSIISSSTCLMLVTMMAIFMQSSNPSILFFWQFFYEHIIFLIILLLFSSCINYYTASSLLPIQWQYFHGLATLHWQFVCARPNFPISLLWFCLASTFPWLLSCFPSNSLPRWSHRYKIWLYHTPIHLFDISSICNCPFSW